MQTLHYKKITWILVLFPIVSLIISALSWLRFGIDMPLWDDWRNYSAGNIGRLDLKFLFKSVNDTLFPVGEVLDSIAFRFLDGNTIAYQFISLVSVLGLLLLLQWRLLTIALQDRFLVASAFSLTILMLQPDTYWGWQNLAYHQALPLVFSLGAIYIIFRGSWKSWWAIPLLIILGLLSGFSYISGAFAILTIGTILLIISKFIEVEDRKPIFLGGLSLFFAGFVSTLAQLWVIIFLQKGTHRPDAPMAFPTDSNFWSYMLGKVARSIMLPIGSPVLSLAITCFLVSTVIIVILFSINLLRKKTLRSSKDNKSAIIYISISGLTFVYLSLVSAGRANLHPPEVKTFMEVFSFGFYRFHFFWVTIFWPWFAAIIFTILIQLGKITILNLYKKLAIVMPIFMVIFLSRGVINHAQFFKQTMVRRSDGIRCMIEALQKGKDIYCSELDIAPLQTAFLNAKYAGASFARFLELPVLPVGTDSANVLFKLSAKNWLNSEFRNTEIIEARKDFIKLKSKNDSMIFFRTANTTKMAACRVLDIGISMRVYESDISQLFFKLPGQTDFIEAESRTRIISPGDKFIDIFFTVFSPNGFIDELRFDPVTKSQAFDLREIEVRCR